MWAGVSGCPSTQDRSYSDLRDTPVPVVRENRRQKRVCRETGAEVGVPRPAAL